MFWSPVTPLTLSPPALSITHSSSATWPPCPSKMPGRLLPQVSVLALPSAQNSLPQDILMACFLTTFRYLHAYHLVTSIFFDHLIDDCTPLTASSTSGSSYFCSVLPFSIGLVTTWHSMCFICLFIVSSPVECKFLGTRGFCFCMFCLLLDSQHLVQCL